MNSEPERRPEVSEEAVEAAGHVLETCEEERVRALLHHSRPGEPSCPVDRRIDARKALEAAAPLLQREERERVERAWATERDVVGEALHDWHEGLGSPEQFVRKRLGDTATAYQLQSATEIAAELNGEREKREAVEAEREELRSLAIANGGESARQAERADKAEAALDSARAEERERILAEVKRIELQGDQPIRVVEAVLDPS